MSHKFAETDSDSDISLDESDNEYDLTEKEIKEKKREKKQKIKQQEEEETRCGECDKYINDDGCDCRVVCCMVCAATNKIYSMEHILDKETDAYENTCLAERLDGYYCYDCNPHEEEEESQERYSCDGDSENDDW